MHGMGRSRLVTSWLWALFWVAFSAAGATAAAIAGGKTGPRLAAAVAALGLYCLPYYACITTSVRRDMRRLVGHSHAKLAAGGLTLVAVYLLYAFGTHTFAWQACIQVAAFVFIPIALLASRRPDEDIGWQDYTTVACIWLPFNFGLLDGIWEWPEGQAAYILNTPLAVDTAILGGFAWRRYDFLRLRWQVNRRELVTVCIMLLLFMAIALPIGLGTGFLRFNPRLDVAKVLMQPLAIFFFIAMPEEFLFRGLLQGMLLKRIGRPLVAVLIASALFGISHWHDAGLPDFRYVGLATIAGMVYGFTYLRSRSIVVPALLHTAVDSLWELFFHL